MDVIMRTVIALVTFLITLVLLSVPVHADDPQSAMAVLVNQNVELTPGSLMNISIVNLGGERGALSSTANCDKLEGYIRFIGTAAPSGREEDGLKTLNLLHQRSFNLSPGEVLPLQFQQASETMETVIVETVVPPHAKHCLSASNATILNSSGDLVSVATQSRDRELLVIVTPSPPAATCCACAPVCGCGFCD